MGSNLATYEIYDPNDGDMGTWTDPQLYPEKHLQQARAGHAAIELKDGNVLVVGGGSDFDTAYTSEIYQPKTGNLGIPGQYIQSGLNFPRTIPYLYSDLTATLLEHAEGWVLLAGGVQVGCELFKPRPPAGFSLGRVPRQGLELENHLTSNR